MSTPHVLLSALLLSSAMPGAQAATAWDEAVSGDLANVGTSPTALSLVPGTNLVSGTTGRSAAGVVDRDYFTFTLPAGWQLDALTMLPGTTFLGPSALSFIAVQAGTQVTVNPTGGSAAGLLGWWHYGENDMGTDILPFIGFGPGATGFIGPLPAGSYAFWIQETATGSAAYNFDFSVSVVPEPASLLLLAAGLAGLGSLRSRMRVNHGSLDMPLLPACAAAANNGGCAVPPSQRRPSR
ncbi:MAG: PEP-CTERM sorting domain-containing protein [Rubrivivax sp.]|nr:PEP-CTERM sorting domain-containing protein [Rubrivivax sp.]